MSENARLFIAAALSDDVLAALAASRRALEAEGAAGLRWVRPEGIHLTLRFLGDTPLERQAAIEVALRRVAEDTTPIALALGELGSFGGGRPRVVWAGIRGDTDALVALAHRLNRALVEAGFTREERAFQPHLTLARVPNRAGRGQRQALLRALERAPAPAPRSFRVETVQLIRSHLGPGGARYETLCCVRCEGRAAD